VQIQCDEVEHMHMENEIEIIVGDNVANGQIPIEGTIDVTSIHVESANL
jgi:hypothetical protein